MKTREDVVIANRIVGEIDNLKRLYDELTTTTIVPCLRVAGNLLNERTGILSNTGYDYSLIEEAMYRALEKELASQIEQSTARLKKDFGITYTEKAKQ